MSHQDRVRKVAQCSHADDLHTALQWLLAGVSWSTIAFRADCTWAPMTLVYAGMLATWSDERTLGERFQTARHIITYLFGEQIAPAGSYQAWIKLLNKWTAPLLAILQAHFRRRMREALASVWEIAGWVVLACDGSRIDLPRTRRNEERYSPRSRLSRAAQKRRRQARKRRRAKALRAQEARERKANIPRMWLTMFWHVGSGLPWDWRTGPSDSSERAHLQEMLGTLPERTLITADAGFVGFELWSAIEAADHQLLVRVGGHVRLLKQLGYARERKGLVYLWPDAIARKKQPPLVLRLIVARKRGKPVYLVTSVLNAAQLSDLQAAEIYSRRWGIELFYRNAKQTFQRGKLRSHNPDNAWVEMQWTLLAIWAMGLHSHHRLVQQGVSPARISFAGVLRAYQRPMREYRSRPRDGERLTEILDRALIDDYERSDKTSREYPRKKEQVAAGPPIILKPNRAQRQLAQQLRRNVQKG